MDPITPTDRLVALLRQQLKERSVTRRGAAVGRAAPDKPAVTTLQALMAAENLDERQVYRALIHELLAEQFGTGVSADAKFQNVVDRVLDALLDDPAGAGLLRSSVRALTN